MLFNSYAFVFAFLPLTLLGYFLLGRRSRAAAAIWLAFASVVFYGYWSIKYVPLLLASVVFNFLCGRRLSILAQTAQGRVLLIASVATNLLLLAIFKYADFLLSCINDVAGMSVPLPAIVLPIGISFYTFTQIAFLVDAYRARVREYRFNHYLLFVSYFPHLIAGPILHHAEIMPQFQSAGAFRFSERSFAVGITEFAIGLAKKVLVADHFAAVASPVFDAAHNGASMPLLAAWAGVFAYSFELYFDFSGYTDMAIGISRLFGVRLPINFDSPYKAASMIEFWRRWHMTLSRFLRDYLYFSLGGNRKGVTRRYVNILVTMVLGGLWHGANYTFLAWGALHGVFLMANRAMRAVSQHSKGSTAAENAERPTVMGVCVTFLSVSIAWVFFRSADLESAWRLLGDMAAFMQPLSSPVTTQQLLPRNTSELLLEFLGAGVLIWGMPNTRQIIEGLERNISRGPLGSFYGRLVPAAAGVLLATALLEMRKVSSFLYFQF